MQHSSSRRITLWILTAALFLLSAVPSFAEERVFEGAPAPPETGATSVILMDGESGEILYEKDAHEKRDPASITKILNCLVCLDRLDMNQQVTVDVPTTNEGSKMKLKEGETLTVGDIVYAMMLWSANDGAEYLGYLAGDGDMGRFCEMMNEKARSLGALDTAYVNPNGLNNEEVNNITTAYDIAVVVREAMKDERFRQIVGSKEYVIPATNLSEARYLTNTNFCLWSDVIYAAANGDEAALNQYMEKYNRSSYDPDSEDAAEVRQAAKDNAAVLAELMYQPCMGVKTGYSSTAGDCFAGYAKEGDLSVIAVVLNEPHSKEKFRDAKKLWEYSFANFQVCTAQAKEGFSLDLPVKRGTLREVTVGIPEDLRVTILKDEDPAESVTTEIVLNEEKPMAPIETGDVVGQLIAYENGREIAREDLISLETAGEGTVLSYVGIADEDLPQFFVLLGGFLVILIILLAARGRSKRKIRKMRKGK